jgi:hypothetical protein
MRAREEWTWSPGTAHEAIVHRDLFEAVEDHAAHRGGPARATAPSTIRGDRLLCQFVARRGGLLREKLLDEAADGAWQQRDAELANLRAEGDKGAKGALPPGSPHGGA